MIFNRLSLYLTVLSVFFFVSSCTAQSDIKSETVKFCVSEAPVYYIWITTSHPGDLVLKAMKL